MKTIIFFLLAITASAQDTIRSVKSINTSTHRVVGYIVQSVAENDTTYQRVDKFTDLPKGIKVNKKDPIKNYPKSLLRKGEVLMNHKRSNIKGFR
jgi:hypothetical protein